MKTTLTDGSPVTPNHTDIDPSTGMQKGYVVLNEEERRRGFVEPVRNSYVHAGLKVCGHDLGVEAYLAEGESRLCGDAPGHEGDHGARVMIASESEMDRFRRTGFLRGCGGVTSMGASLSETYAAQPNFYSGTYCSNCRSHFPVGETGEFFWEGTMQRVGTISRKA